MKHDSDVATTIILALVVLAVAPPSYAGIPDSNGIIHGCYLNTLGSLRVIDPSAGQKCFPVETPLQWSQRGPQGPASHHSPLRRTSFSIVRPLVCASDR